MRFLSAVAALTFAASAFGLGVGDKAPPIAVAAFVKGKVVDVGHGVHVIEFWATWCGPCRTSIPHLTEMAKKYKGKVDFTGISVSERGADQLGQVRKYVANMGPRMDYNVAFDGPSQNMDTGYMKAANQDGIPAAFLIKDGVIFWIGHPMGGLDHIIDRVLDGSFSIATAKAEATQRVKDEAEEVRRSAAEESAMAPARAALHRGDHEGGLKELDKIDVSKDKLLAHHVLMARFYTLARMGDPRLNEVAKAVAREGGESDETLLSVVARDLVDPESKFPASCYPVAQFLAEQAVTIAPKQPLILDCYASVLAKNGQTAKAVEAVEDALKYAKANPKSDPDSIKWLQRHLELLKKPAGQ